MKVQFLKKPHSRWKDEWLHSNPIILFPSYQKKGALIQKLHFMYNSGGASIHAEGKGASRYRLWSAPVTKNRAILSREVELDNVEVCSISPATAAHKCAVFQVFGSREDAAPRTKAGGGGGMGCVALGRNAKSTDNGHTYPSLIITPPSEVTKLLRELWELWMEVTAANSNKNTDTKGGKGAKTSRPKQY